MDATTTLTPLPTLDPLLSATLARVPRSCRSILDLGCGTGRLGQLLKERRHAAVVGLEVDVAAAQVAHERLDRIILGTADHPSIGFAPGQFDCIVGLDLLPFLREPSQLLRRIRPWLANGAPFLTSVPNVRHHRTIADLLQGRWTYRVEGPAHRPQLRFFTRRETEKLFYRCGFGIPRLHLLAHEDLDAWRRQGRPTELQIGALHLQGLSVEEAEEFYVERYLVEARPVSVPEMGLTSIVLVTHNQLAYTRTCLDSIRLYTDEPYELIVVDNGSTDGTVSYLRQLPDVRLLTNPDNRGFARAVNQGLAVAKGQQLLLLNNDTVVTTGWLRRLLDALHNDPRIGLVGPVSNCVSGEQQIAVRYDADLVGLDGFAWEWGKAHVGVRDETDRLVGFCLLLRRAVFETIGPLDERFGIGCFEDDDYCLRALRAGYRAVVARDAFVHHFGGRTFVGAGVDLAALLRHNRQLFLDKWSEEQPVTSMAPAKPGKRRRGTPPAPSGAARPHGPARVSRAPQLSLCMIVRDGARTLPACLESIRPWVDEMIVVDTGSQDRTVQLAEEMGARVFHFPWCDSFAVARNESLRHANGVWIFWMDADDVMDAANGRRLRELVNAVVDPQLLGYVLQVHCPGPGVDGQADVTIVDHVKLFRNRPELRFEGRIHEQILPAIRRANGDVAWTDVHVVHAGYDHSPEGQRRKLQRDLHLLHLELQEQPTHPFTLFNLGMTYADQGQFTEAADYLRRSIAQAGPGESHLRKAYALLVYSLAHRERSAEAFHVCQQGLQLFPQDVELRFRHAILLHAAGRLQEAVTVYQGLLQSTTERHFTSIDRGIAGFKARHNLALVYTDLGALDAAETQWRQVVQEMPGYRPGWRGLGDNLLTQKRYDAVRHVVEQLTQDDRLQVEASFLRGRLAWAEGRLPEARVQLEQGFQEDPDDHEVRETLCRLLFEQAEPGEVEPALRSLVERSPKDAAARHNLGLIYLRLGQPSAAVAMFQASLELRPNSAETHFYRGNALQALGRSAEAHAAWQQAVQLDPAHFWARTALDQVSTRDYPTEVVLETSAMLTNSNDAPARPEGAEDLTLSTEPPVAATAPADVTDPVS